MSPRELGIKIRIRKGKNKERVGISRQWRLRYYNNTIPYASFEGFKDLGEKRVHVDEMMISNSRGKGKNRHLNGKEEVNTEQER